MVIHIFPSTYFFGQRFTTEIHPALTYFMAYHIHLLTFANTKFRKTLCMSLCGLAVISAVIHAQGALYYEPQFLRAITARQ